jgi:hypothetical protein
MKIFSKIKALFARNNDEGVIIVERGQFAKEMKEKFGGKIELLKAIEECMNRTVSRNEYVRLTDQCRMQIR